MFCNLGELGEEVACRYLISKGFKLVARNWHCRYGELDIVCEKGKETVFVEVKTRSSERVGGFSDYVNKSKLRKLRFSIDEYLCKKGSCGRFWRLDGILLIREKEHFRLHYFRGLLD